MKSGLISEFYAILTDETVIKISCTKGRLELDSADLNEEIFSPVAICDIHQSMAFIGFKISVCHNWGHFYKHIQSPSTAFCSFETEPVAALFFTSNEAFDCRDEGNLVPCDNRWSRSTIEVLQEIGSYHHKFGVISIPNFNLIINNQSKTLSA